MTACFADEPAEGCDAIDRMFDGLDARFTEMFGDLSEGSWLSGEGSGYGSDAEWSEWDEGSGYGSDADSGEDYGTTDMEEWCEVYGCDAGSDYGSYGDYGDYGDYGTVDDDSDYGTVDFA